MIDDARASPQATHWRHLRRAIAFFLVCLAVSVALFTIGFYH